MSKGAYLVLLPLLFGCGGAKTHPVDGKVVFSDGAAATELNGYTVSFDCPEHKVSASGIVQQDGTFHVGTFDENDGAMAGKQLVAITPPAPPLDAPLPPPVIDRKYSDMSTSGLEVTIKPGANPVVLTVERAKN